MRDERASVPDIPNGAVCLFGDRCFLPYKEDILFISPSVRRERKEVSDLIKTVGYVSSDCETFFESVKAKVIAVSGSDGKSTSCAMAAKILENGGHSVQVVGNFGTPMTPCIGSDGYFVAELSSFMLSYASPSTVRAALTNVTPNHLNWHADMDEYTRAKSNLLRGAAERVISYDCPICRGLARGREFAAFSALTPFDTLKRAFVAEHYFTLEGGYLKRDGVPVIARKEIPAVGVHNAKNALCALALTDGLAPTADAAQALCEFKGLKHRCELVGTLGEVRFYDSSIDSTPERTRATLSSFDTPLTVILGGRGKKLPLTPLDGVLDGRIFAAVLLGENAPEIEKYIKRAAPSVKLILAESMTDAVHRAAALGKTVVLSPAATSFDRYESFEERGRDFSAAVKALK